MVGWLPGKSKGKKMGTLERKTAELADKLSRMSFRRHSAPARQNSTSEDLGADLSLDPNLSTRMDDDVCDAIVIDVLPVHLLELVLRHLTLKDLARAALTHTSWKPMAMNETLWRARLREKIPKPVLTLMKLNRDTKPWAQQLNAFYSTNLIANPVFSSSGISVSRGLVKDEAGMVGGWKVQWNCWQVDKAGVGEKVQPLARSCGGDRKMKVLTLTTPQWTLPEASQEIDLVACLREKGMTPLEAAEFLDTCPEFEFSVWVSCGDGQPEAWQTGFAAVVLDNGKDDGAGWQGLKLGTQIYRDSAKGLWISWVIDHSLLRSSESLKQESYLHLARGRYKKLSCVFSGYEEGVRRAHVLLKGLDPRMVYQGPSSGIGLHNSKPTAEFIAPVLRFRMPEA